MGLHWRRNQIMVLLMASAATYASRANAQGAVLPTPASPSAESQASAAASQSVTNPSQEKDLGEIVVTATKRNERLQAVPISVMATESITLERMAIQSAKEFGQIAPTLNFQAADEARLFNFSIRGIGTENFSVGVEPSVSTIVDGVVYTRVGSVFDGLGDIDRVEVLNGPQGTLQGKNSSAGAVSIITKKPNFSRFEGKAEAGIAEHGERSAALTLTGPISQQLAFRVYGYYRREDGVVHNIATGRTENDAKSYGVRAKVEWRPHDGVDFLLAGDWSRRDAPCCAEPIRVAAAAGNVTAAFTGTPVGPENRFVNINTVQEGQQKNRGVSLEGNIDIGRHVLTTITAYREYKDYAIRDRDGTNAPFTGVTPQQLFNATVPGITAADALTRLDALLLNPLSFSCRNGICGESNNLEMNKTFSQEVRLTSPSGGTFDYILGAFYYDSNVERDLTIAGVRSNIAGNVSFPTPTTVVVNRDTAYVLADAITKVRTINKAVFGNLNVRPFAKLTLTGGFRYLGESLDWDHQKVTGPNGDHIGSPLNVNPAGQVAPGANAGTPQFNAHRRFSDTALIGKLSGKYDFTHDLMVYASWARGYKGEAVDADIYVSQAGFNASPVAPEKSRSWEAGMKSQWFDRRLTINVTAYNTLFTGYQTASQGTDGSGPPVLQSAGKLFTKGVEGEVVLRPVPHLRLGGNFLFSKNRFGNLFLSSTRNIAGGKPLNAPESKWGLTGSYDVPVADWNVNLSANYNRTGRTLFTNLADANNPNSIWWREAYGVANASLSVSSPGNKYRATLYVKNLFNEHYVASLRRISGSVGGAGAVVQALPRDFDRYVGGSVAVSF
jgi:iron complex outermembrane receptor protein